MATDIVPALLADIRARFQKDLTGNPWLMEITYRIRDGTATPREMIDYAELLGESLSDALQAVLTPDALPDGKMYYNIANRTVKPLLRENYNNVNQIAAAVQAIMDEADGIGLKAVTADFPEERVNGLIDMLTDSDTFTKWLGEPIVNTTMSFADDFVKANAEFRYKSGMDVRIVRETEAEQTKRRKNKSKYVIPCKWCARLAGTYPYEDARHREELFQRHESCRCRVTYINGKEFQNVWSKEIWNADADTLNRRASTGTQLQFGERG